VIERLREARIHACRLTPDRALRSVDEAEAFLNERGMLTLAPDCALPSLFGATHEESYIPGGRGFAAWPRTKWSWRGALAERPGVLWTKIYRGKGLFLSAETAQAADPLCRAALADVEDGRAGAGAARLVAHLAATGPRLLEDLQLELGIEAQRLRTLRESVERVGALVGREETVLTMSGGHRHTTRLHRWDQVVPGVSMQEPKAALGALLVAGVRAAVLVPTEEVRAWFSWPIPSGLLEDLVSGGQLVCPAPGWLAADAVG
jgi:hypothetical protein